MSTSHDDPGEMWRRLDADDRAAQIFYPRRERGPTPRFARDYDIPVAPGVTLGARWHRFEASDTTMLAFHGNGETVSGYDDVALGWHGVGVNLFMTDYRGYGWSAGKPGLRALCEDAIVVADFLTKELGGSPAAKPLVFGRSLGSLPATLVAVERGDAFRALILESSFGDVASLMQRYGFSPAEISPEICRHLSNAELLKNVRIPVLVLHGALDDLLPPSNAEANYAAIPHERKMLRLIPGADHNDIIAYAKEYFGAVGDFLHQKHWTKRAPQFGPVG